MMLNRLNSMSRINGFLLTTRRTWFKKGEYQLKRPHGISLNSFQAGDGWNWLTDHYEYIDQVKDQMKRIRRKTGYTYSSEDASLQKAQKTAHFKTKTLGMGSRQRHASEEVEKFSTVELIAELKRRYQVLSRPERSCVLVGPAYAGVTSQASFLKKEWSLCHISRNDIMKPNSELDLSKGMSKLSEELSSFRCRRGFAISNFPGNAEEATSLDGMLKEQHPKLKDYKVVLFSLPSESDNERETSLQTLNNRAKGDLIHVGSSRRYNSNVPELAPQNPFVDDITGEPLVSPQWNISNLSEKINKWWNVSQPSLTKYYGTRLSSVDATQSIDSVSTQISRILLNIDAADSQQIS